MRLPRRLVQAAWERYVAPATHASAARVALKALPAAFATDADRMARFQLVVPACALSAMPAAAQDRAALWNAVANPQFEATKTATVKDLALERDQIHTFDDPEPKPIL
jgi:hypothetical protein